MIKERLKGLIEGILPSVLAETSAPGNFKVVIEKPRLPEHGDFACGLALNLACGDAAKAMSIASQIVENLAAVPKDICLLKANSPGFINFSLGPYWLCQALLEIHLASEDFLLPEPIKAIDTTLIASKENSVFYIQYMHAKLASYLRLAAEERMNTETMSFEPALIAPDAWGQLIDSYKQHPLIFKALFSTDQALFAKQKKLVLHLDSYGEKLATQAKDPHFMHKYAYELACLLDEQSLLCPLFSDKQDTTKAQLGLIVAAKRVLAHTLGITGLDTPTGI